MIKKENKKDSSKIFLIIIILVGLFLVSAAAAGFIALFMGVEKDFGNVAMIKIHGPIYVEKGSSFGESSTSSEDVLLLLKDAEESPNIQAIILDINSPGGSPVASKEIADAVKASQKKTIALIRESGTSGAYWVASAADTIIADDLSITGSIGVISSYLEFEGLINRYNMSYERLVAGEYKDVGDPFKKLTPKERDMLQEKLDKIHNYFIAVVAHNRNLSMDKAKALATGEIYLGMEALEEGLVDKIGNLETAKEMLKQELNLTSVDIVEYENSKSFMDLLAGVMSDNSFSVGRGIGDALTSYPSSGQRKILA